MAGARWCSKWLICSLLILFASGPALAQTARSGGGASAQLLQQMQQLASERTALQAENARMKKELDDLRKERDALKKAQQGVDERARVSAVALARSTEQRAGVEQELKTTKDRMQELIAKFRETVQTLRQTETETTAAKQTLATRDREMKVCVDRNLALYRLNDEILTRFEHESTWTRVARAEPFTRLKRIELENLVDDYKAKAQDQKLDPATSTAAAGAAR